MLEQQSTLISSLANATQQNRGHQHDHLIPLLEGQQSVLEKLTTVESTQAEVTDRLAQFDDQQSEVVGELRLQIEEITAENSELADRVHQLELELLESRHTQEITEKEAGEDRDKLEIAQSRNAALEQHLQTLIKEKQCLVREIEEDQKTRQDQTSQYEKAQADLDGKHEELIAEKGKNETLSESFRSQSSELAELRHSTSRFQETLVDRLSRIEEGVQGSSDHSAELAKLRAQNEQLQEEVNSLKEQVSNRKET
jgi:chromosome segregation ATPase